jgi:hypothetical protein
LCSAMTIPIGCKQKEESPSVRAFLSLAEQDTAGLLLAERDHARCEKTFSADVESPAPVELCIQYAADTESYSYRAVTNEPLLRGKSVHVNALGLKP